jgi:hypothetical protein
LTAYVAHRAGQELPPQALREFARAHLPDYMVPARQILLPALPRTASGKVNRAALPRPEDDAPAALTEYVPPSTNTERALAAIFAEVLGAARVGARDDFFDLGGHSLLATQVLSRVRDRLGAALPLRTLFLEPTVAGLARAVDEFDASETDTPAGPIRRVHRNGSSGGPADSTIDPRTAADYLDRLDDLSDDEVEALLARMGDGAS